MLYLFRHLLCLIRGATVPGRKDQSPAWLCLAPGHCPINETSNLQMQLQEKSQASLIDSPDLYKSLVSITCATGQYSLLGDIPCAPAISLPAFLRQHTDHSKLCLHWKRPREPCPGALCTMGAAQEGRKQNKASALNHRTSPWPS